VSNDISGITAAQIRAARSLVNMTGLELAERANLGLATIRRAEAATTTITKANLAAIRTALEAAGVIFVEENGEGPGVRLRKA